MRLYTPAKASSSGGEESERETTVTRREKHFPYDPRPPHRTTENDKPHDDNLSRGDDTTTTTTTPLRHSSIQDSLPFKSPLREEALDGRRTEVNGEGHGNEQNGAAPHDLSPSLLQNGADTICSLDSVPWNLDGIETIKENGCKTLLGKWPLEENGEETHGLQDEDELQVVKQENKKLKTALKEAAEVNGQWRQYHEQRQQYVQRLLTTLHDLQHPRASAHSPRQQLEVDQGGPEGAARRLQEALTRLQADHDEHVTLLEMQVRAHRDDWEAERSEKQATQTALAEAQARTALLLQELQLLQAKLADSESKRGLCWRCAGPIGCESHSASPSTQASPVPAPTAPSPSPGPAVSPTPLQEAPQAPLKGWIPVSMLHQIAFSGATPEHQTPVVQRPLTPSRGQLHHHHHHHHHQRPTSLNTNTGRQGERGQQDGVGGRVVESKVPSPRRTPSRDRTPASGEAEERKKYEAMGARPKVLGNLQSAGGKGEDLIEDEKSAKHRARSILASALPVSPVSGGPATPFGITKSPSTPNMPKGYVPITSTILTPINFRPPFVAHKRPSAIKQNSHQNSTSTTTTTTTSKSTHTRSASSASSTTATALTTSTTTTTSANRSTPTPNRQPNTSSTPAESQGNIHNTSHAMDTSKSSAVTTQESKVTKTHSRGSRNQVRTGTQDRKKSTASTSPTAAATTTLTTTTLSTHSTNTTSNTNTINLANINTTSPSILTTTTTTLSSSSPTPSASYSAAASSNRKSDSASSKSTNHPARDVVTHQSLPNSAFQAATAGHSSFTTNTTVSPSVTSSAQTKGHDNTSNSKGRTGAPRTSHKATKPLSPLPDISTTTTEGHLQQGTATTGSLSSPTNTTAFAAITVTSTTSSMHMPPSPSTYSSTPSSRSSSPGISLTTFGLNSEGRGIPGAIFFALSPEQRGARSPQQGVSSRRASTSSSGTHSHTPDPVTGSYGHDGRPPAGMKSPPVAPNRPTTPSTVREEHWWSVEGGNRGSTNGRQQHGTQGKLVNSTWVKLMGSRVDGRQSSGLPWRTARAVSGQTLKQARRTTSEGSSGDPSEPTSPGSMSSTATFSYTPAVNSPPSSANSSAASSPPPSLNQRDDLKSMASKNIASAIMSYELSTKCEGAGGSASTPVSCPDGVDTLTRQDLVCPSCQMLFPHDKHILFLDHFEACRGPAYADL